ncbi:MAG: hydroxymethylbilane synthase [Nitrospirae bacterium]|nr:hydroxymethylbilane synthase [Nitrospirota bacterium]
MKITIGTRGSKLALWQAHWVQSRLIGLHDGLEVEIKTIMTKGDKILDVSLAKVGGKGLFVKEIEDTILRGESDLAVHSMKDVPTELPAGLHLGAICEREEPLDALVCSKKLCGANLPESISAISAISPVSTGATDATGNTESIFYALPRGITIGTSSLRRSSQLLSLRPDLNIVQLRGNLDTRLRKLDDGEYDAIIVAVAGLKRLGAGGRITERLAACISLPAIGQGAVGIECRIDDKTINALIAPLNHEETAVCVKAERAFLKRLMGGCQVPIAAYATLHHRGTEDAILVDGLVASVSGDRIVRGSIEGSKDMAETLGFSLAEDLLARGAKEILDEVYQNG